jgi:hypothetical protein
MADSDRKQNSGKSPQLGKNIYWSRLMIQQLTISRFRIGLCREDALSRLSLYGIEGKRKSKQSCRETDEKGTANRKK